MAKETRAKLWLAMAYALAGRTAEARRLIAEVDDARDKELIGFDEFANVYASLGETDKMFQYLNKASLQKDATLPVVLVDPLYKRYRSDPRFIALKTKVGI
jgi:hypothetical protein